jgi:hypothetical protein
MTKPKASSLLFFFAIVVIIAIATFFGPEEQSLGANVRVVYLHGAWVLTAELVLILAGLAGALGLLGLFVARLAPHKATFLNWSEVLGQTGMVFWVTYLPLSLWAMESNWNGLFLSEPRFRLAVTFAVVGVLMQAGLWFISNKLLTAAANIAYIVALLIIFATAQNIMHPPPSPIFNSGNYVIIGFFVVLNLLTWIAAFFLSRWWLSLSLKR